MESIVAIFCVVYTCCTASYKAVSGLIKLHHQLEYKRKNMDSPLQRCPLVSH